jgi:hypothetical protein
LRTLPEDNVRQILWRFADRCDLQMLVQSAREVARGPVARLVAGGLRSTHEWTEQKATLLEAFDQSGITAVFMDPEQGGYLVGPKNLALALIAFELPRPAASPDAWRWRRSTNAVPRNSAPAICHLPFHHFPEPTVNRGAGRFA